MNVEVEIIERKKRKKYTPRNGMRITNFYSHKRSTDLQSMKFKVLLVNRHKTKLKQTGEKRICNM